MKKMEDFLAAEGCSTIKILHNNHYRYGEYGICGTRGWVNMPGETQDEKVLKREVQRLETSIKSALAEGLKPIVFLHYPPIFATNFNYDILEILYRYNISDCYYGHIHGRSAHDLCIKNTYDGININPDETAKTDTSANNGTAVYRTPSGKKYHFDPQCGGKNSFETTLKEAVSAGLTPCSKCAD